MLLFLTLILEYPTLILELYCVPTLMLEISTIISKF